MAFEFENLRPDNGSNSNDHEFAQAVADGLSRSPKYLPSWLIFDDRGSELFQEIVRLENYLPAVCEFEIIHTYKQVIADIIQREGLQIIDLGCGDAGKTQVLLEHMLRHHLPVHFIPIDISCGAVQNLVATLESKYQGTPLTVTGIAADFFQGLEAVARMQSRRNFVFFLGATIGNQDFSAAGKFLQQLAKTLNAGDYVMIGFDLMKNPKLLYNAYNDAGGVIEKFNLHLLDRINQNLGADFDKSKFVQEGRYSDRSHAVESHVYSTETQTVRIPALGGEFHFQPWESIQTEHSYKFTMPEIAELAQDNGFEIVEHLFDSKQYYVNSVWKVKE